MNEENKEPTTEQPTAAATDKGAVVKANDVDVRLTRTETERVKEGKEPTAYYTVELAQFGVPVIGKDGKPMVEDGKPIFDAEKTLVKIADVLTLDTLIEKLQAKLNQDCRGAQMDAGKDSYTMSEKLKLLTSYVENGFGAQKKSRKSPIEMAQSEYMATAANLKAKYCDADGKVKPEHQAEYTKLATEARTAFMARVAEITAGAMAI